MRPMKRLKNVKLNAPARSCVIVAPNRERHLHQRHDEEQEEIDAHGNDNPDNHHQSFCVLLGWCLPRGLL